MTDSQSRPLAGMLWMVATGVSFVAVTALVKSIGSDIPAAQAAFLRYVLGLVFILPVLASLLRTLPSRANLSIFALRGLIHTGAVIAWFFAMTQIPIAEVTAMNYFSPVYVTIGAALFLGEKLAARRIAAICVALLGALIILRPGFRELSPGHFAMLGTALGFAISYLLAKRLVRDLSPGLVVAWLSIFVSIGLAPFAIAVWVTPSPWHLVVLFGVACFATLGHYTMTRAFQAAPMSVTQPVTFLQLVWATALGALVFGEAVDGFVVLGGGLIVAAISFLSWREARLRRGVITPSVSEPKT
ncbi:MULTISPECIES: DMT family transporter [Dinoroseobacter]|nr:MULTISPECIES: DMT family transporter [Dinoroseobacter]MDD9718280.1 DMT family transporter [Dinoroseobacter sp. PD6]URF47404.1 DMT family transporter [Dinoroseobacter shibae]URF51715.1 DMT family transporter [Dinoroseobacter shibae]